MVKIAHSDGYSDRPPEILAARKPQTRFDEERHTVFSLMNQLVASDFTIVEAQRILPTIIAGVKSERAYRREQQQTLKTLGFTVGRALYRDFIADDEAGHLLYNFHNAVLENPNAPSAGLELGHIELANGDHSPNAAWKVLDNFGENVVEAAGLDDKATKAYHVLPRSRTALIKQQKVDGAPETLARGRTNFPVLDIGGSGLRLFVRVSAGYVKPSAIFESKDNAIVREMHEKYMDIIDNDSGSKGLVVLDKDTGSFGHPLAGTLIAHHRGPAQK